MYSIYEKNKEGPDNEWMKIASIVPQDNRNETFGSPYLSTYYFEHNCADRCYHSGRIQTFISLLNQTMSLNGAKNIAIPLCRPYPHETIELCHLQADDYALFMAILRQDKFVLGLSAATISAETDIHGFYHLNETHGYFTHPMKHSYAWDSESNAPQIEFIKSNHLLNRRVCQFIYSNQTGARELEETYYKGNEDIEYCDCSDEECGLNHDEKPEYGSYKYFVGVMVVGRK
jgi:hypothetical protein